MSGWEIAFVLFVAALYAVGAGCLAIMVGIEIGEWQMRRDLEAEQDAAIKDRNRAEAMREKLRAECKRLHAERDALKRDIEGYKSSAAAQGDIIHELRAERDTLKQALGEAEERICELVSQRDEAEAERDALRDEIDRLNNSATRRALTDCGLSLDYERKDGA